MSGRGAAKLPKALWAGFAIIGVWLVAASAVVGRSVGGGAAAAAPLLDAFVKSSLATEMISAEGHEPAVA